MKGLRHEGSREGSQEAIQHEMAPPIPGSLIGRQMNSFFLKLFPFLKILSSDAQSVAKNQVSVWAICLLSNSCYPIHGHELALGSLSACVGKSGLRWKKTFTDIACGGLCVRVLGTLQNPRAMPTLMDASVTCLPPGPLLFLLHSLSSSSSSISFLFSNSPSHRKSLHKWINGNKS